MKKYLCFLIAAMLLLTGCQRSSPTEVPELSGTGPVAETDPTITPDVTNPPTQPTEPSEPTEPGQMQTVWVWTEQVYQSNVEGSGSLLTRTYDEMGNLIIDNYASRDGKITYGTTFVYDSRGRLVEEENYYTGYPNVKTTYTYDSNGQIATESFSDGQGNEGIVEYAYLENGLMSGKLLTQGETVDCTAFTYDEAGRLLKETRVVTTRGNVTSTHKVEHTYDGAGNKLSEINTSGTKKLWTYDETGRLLSYQELSVKDYLLLGKTYEYDENGRVLLEYNYEGDMQTPDDKYIYEYDESGRIAVKYICTPNSSRLNASQVVHYTYDEHGNLLSEVCTDKKGAEISSRAYTYISMEIPVK